MDTGFQPVISIRGKNIALGPLHRGLIPINQVWMNQFDTTRFLAMGIYTLESEVQWYERVINSPNIHFFAIYELPDLRPIGGVDLHKVDLQHRRAELGIMIGEKDARGKGYGTEAVQLICDYGFTALGLNSIMLLTYDWNIAGKKAYERAGFKEMGRRRQARWFDGAYWDDVYYDLLANEFESPVIRHQIMSDVTRPDEPETN